MSLTPSNENVKLWLELSEGSGTTANDSSGEGNNGTISGASWVKIPNGGYALNFDGVDDYVSFDNIVSTPFSISLWVNPDSGTGVFRSVFETGTNYGLIVYTDRLLTYSSQGGSYIEYISSSEWSNYQNTWIHVVVVFDGTTEYGYINGNLKVSGARTISSYSYLKLGVGAWNDKYLDGKIRKPIILNTALTASQVKKLYQDLYISEE